MQRSTRIVGSLIVLLFIVETLFVWFEYSLTSPTNVILVPNGSGALVILTQSVHSVVIGGGKDGSVVRTLAQEFPWYEHTIDALFLTQLDTGHSGGAIDIIRRYDPYMLYRATGSGNGSEWVELQKVLGGRANRVLDRTSVSLGKDVEVDTLFPDRLMPHTDLHTGCATLRIHVGTTTMLMVCDTDPRIVPYMVYMEGEKLKSDIVVISEALISSYQGQELLGYADPHMVVVLHSCETQLATSTRQILAQFALVPTDLCTKNLRFDPEV